MSESQNPLSDAIRSTGVPAVIDTLRVFVEKLFGEAAEEVGGLLADNVRSWRASNQRRILLKSKELLDDADMQAHDVPPRTLVPLLEAAANEDSQELQELWAALLANAATTDGNATPPAYVEILRQLSPFDAKILTEHFTIHGLPRPSSYESGVFARWSFRDVEAGERALFAAAAANLERLGIVRVSTVEAEKLRLLVEQLQRADIDVDTRQGRGRIKLDTYRLRDVAIETSSLTVLGVDFLRSCLPPIALPIPSPEFGETLDQHHWTQTLVQLQLDLAHHRSLTEALAAAQRISEERFKVLRAEREEAIRKRESDRIRIATQHPMTIDRFQEPPTRHGKNAVNNKNALIEQIESYLREQFADRGEDAVIFTFTDIATAIDRPVNEVSEVLKRYSISEGEIRVWTEPNTRPV